MDMNASLSVMNLLRYLVAYVFIISGIMKLFSTELGHYFIQLKLPYPLTVMFIVAIVEIVCGTLILMNTRVKVASIPLLIIMIGAFLLTKVPLLHTGFLPFAFNARLDILMLVLLFILYSRHQK
jgi:putative oxidoreductase